MTQVGRRQQYGLTLLVGIGIAGGAPEGIPPAPETPEKLEDPEYENAIAGFSDDVYVELEDGQTVGGGEEEPEQVDPTQAPGVRGEDDES